MQPLADCTRSIHAPLLTGTLVNWSADVQVAEMETNKAMNLLKHSKEIHSRPARTWFQDDKEKQGVVKKWRDDQDRQLRGKGGAWAKEEDETAGEGEGAGKKRKKTRSVLPKQPLCLACPLRPLVASRRPRVALRHRLSAEACLLGQGSPLAGMCLEGLAVLRANA